jgi:hypothetical protein
VHGRFLPSEQQKPISPLNANVPNEIDLLPKRNANGGLAAFAATPPPTFLLFILPPKSGAERNEFVF